MMPRRNVQRAVIPCPELSRPCPEQAFVTPNPSGYEFGWKCPAGHAGVIAWAHGSPPPDFVLNTWEPRTPQQHEECDDMAKKAKNVTLPGMEDRAIKPLQTAAEEYAEIRDERMELSQREVKLKAKVLTLMHHHQKEHYAYGGVTIDIVKEEENVKVRVKAVKDDEGEDGPPDE